MPGSRNLILIRHTKSSWLDLSLPDFERPLKEDRIKDAVDMGKHLHHLGLKPDLIICSPATRTRQTADYICEKLKYKTDAIEFDKRIYESTEKDILQVVHEVDAKVKTLVLIGHNPAITHFSNLFIEQKIEEVPTTGVVWLQFENKDWEIYKTTPGKLKYFLTPKTID